MATRTVKQMIDGIVHDVVEEYDEAQEAAKIAKDARIAAIIARPASDAALDDVELMRVWMRFHSAWDDIEQALLFLFKVMMRTKFELSRPVFFSQYTHSGRRTMIEELMHVYLRSHDAERRKLEIAIKRVKSRSGIRNKLMHGIWGWKIDYERELVEVARFEVSPKIDPFSQLYGKKEILQETLKMEETRVLLHSVTEEIDASKSINAYWSGTSYIP